MHHLQKNHLEPCSFLGSKCVFWAYPIVMENSSLVCLFFVLGAFLPFFKYRAVKDIFLD